jgi:UDPglucose--hexose-1-phosphate uridylyltransferase
MGTGVVHKLSLTKPGGRCLTLYSRHPLRSEGWQAPRLFSEPIGANPHLRWHPLRGEWVAYASAAQGEPRPAPSGAADMVTPAELPPGDWEVAVFDHRFPPFAMQADSPPELLVAAAPARGQCDVVVFTRHEHSSLGDLPLAHLELLLTVWADRSQELAKIPGIAYVLPFENRGAEHSSLHRPHGQIYAYPVVPPIPARMQAMALEHYQRHRRGLLQEIIARELTNGSRVIYRGPHAAAFVPVCARYPYEVWLAPLDPVENFAQLNDVQRADLARALKTVLLKYDGLGEGPLPYLMAWYQAPTDGLPHPESHLHAEFYPAPGLPGGQPAATATAGELAAGLFAMHTLPEDQARDLQQVAVRID